MIVLLALVGSAVAIVRSPLFDITDVRVEGVDGERADEARNAAGIGEGDNLLSANLAGAAERVTALPWVLRGEVRRSPPSTVVIEVRPRTPLAVVRLPDAAWVVDAEGVVMGGGQRPGLVAIDAPNSVMPGVGAEISDTALRNALAVHAELPASVRTLVERYEAPSDHGLRLHLANGVAVRFGRAERVEAKARSIELLLDQALRHAEEQGGGEGGSRDLGVAEVDVRAPDNPVLVPATQEEAAGEPAGDEG